MNGEERNRRRVTVERLIAAPAQTIFDVLADPAQHPLIDGSGPVRSARGGRPRRLSPGARFGMSMRIGLPYPVRNTVVDFVEGERIAWTHLGRHRWIYELEPVEGGTMVKETFDYSQSLTPRLYERLDIPERNRRGMEPTLERLERHVVSGG